MHWWTDQLGVGPWFVNQRIGGEGSTYRGEPGKAEFSLALAFSGHMMIELVQDNEITRQMFTCVRRASVDCDGSRPVRDFAELLQD